MISTMDYEVFICLEYNKQRYNLSKHDKFQIKKTAKLYKYYTMAFTKITELSYYYSRYTTSHLPFGII